MQCWKTIRSPKTGKHQSENISTVRIVSMKHQLTLTRFDQLLQQRNNKADLEHIRQLRRIALLKMAKHLIRSKG